MATRTYKSEPMGGVHEMMEGFSQGGVLDEQPCATSTQSVYSWCRTRSMVRNKSEAIRLRNARR